MKKSTYYFTFLSLLTLLMFSPALFPPGVGAQDKPLVLVPLLIGQDWQNAQRQLLALGLTARRLPPKQECQEQWRVNQVLEQRPEAGALLARGSGVALITCQPAIIDNNREVPDLSGLNYAQAKQLLQKMSLHLRVVYKDSCLDPFLQNTIIEQEPEPKSIVRRGSVVFAIICRGRL